MAAVVGQEMNFFKRFFFKAAALLREEKFAGMLLLLATVFALFWANSSKSSAYFSLRDTMLGWETLHLDLTIGHWAGDGLLTIFFFVAGLELKHELVKGQLSDTKNAVLPVAAAFGGVVFPIFLFVVVNGGFVKGWAIPTATDIAFALAVLAVVGRSLPRALRAFLLTLAVVDDLLAISIIAVFFTYKLNFLFLFLALIPLTIFGILLKYRITSWYVLFPLALVAWALVHASGIHSTVAGVVLAFLVPASLNSKEHKLGKSLNEKFEYFWRPISAGFALPIFALFSAGVAFSGFNIYDASKNSMVLGIVFGLVFGKVIGIFGVSYLIDRFTGAELDKSISWVDMLGLSSLAGMGFTVSLLISELTFKDYDSLLVDQAKFGVLVASLLAAFISVVILRRRNKFYFNLEKT